ncbi:MAG TPA: alpha/beta hydrolase [Gaiellaceae bacterium]|jgi:pimeloyl-ACP methyl ester carboxylesterase
MGTSVLLLHAFPVGPEMWQPQLEALAGYEVRAPSLVGRGDSIDGWAEQLLAETADDLVVIGASMGGYCALAIAKRAPERVRGVVLSGSRASADPPGGRAWRDQSIALVREKGALALWQTMRDYAIGPGTDPVAAKRLDDSIAGHDPEGVVQELVAMIGREDTTDVVRTLACPFLAIAGELDQGVIAESKQLAELASDGELVIVPGANHLVSFQRPDLVNPILLRFLERCIG